MATALPPSVIVRRGEMIVCPHRISLGPIEERILWALAAQWRRRRSGSHFEWSAPLLTVDNLLDVAYGDDPDGGSLTADNTLRVHIHKLREILRPMGLEIEIDWGNGYRLERHKTTDR